MQYALQCASTSILLFVTVLGDWFLAYHENETWRERKLLLYYIIFNIHCGIRVMNK